MTATRAKTSKTRANRNKTDELIKYLIKKQNESSFLIEIPASWKVTFAAVNPNSNSGGGYKDSHCVRVWEGEKLRAVFDSVISFRDMSIPFAKEVRKETGSSSWEKDSEGNFKDSTDIKVNRQLVSKNNPFDIDGEALDVF